MDRRTSASTDYVVSGLAAGIAVTMAAYATARYGMGYGPDYVTYLAVARNLLAHGHFVSHEFLYTMWPPLFPALQALGGLVRIDPMHAARGINISAYGSLVGLSVGTLWRMATTRLVRGVGAVAVVGAFPLFTYAIKAGTEALFFTFVVGFLVVASWYLKEPSSAYWWGLVALAIAGSLQRYAGITLIAAAVLCVAFRTALRTGRWHGPSREDLWWAFGTGGITSVPLALWLIRNLWLTGLLTGPRDLLPNHSLVRSLGALVDAVSTWLLPAVLPLAVRGFVLLGVVFLIGIAVRQGGRALSDDADTTARRPPLLRICILFLGLYGTLIIVTGSLGMSPLPSRRFAAPAFVPSLFVVLLLLDRAWCGRSHFLPGLAPLLVVGLLGWTAYQVLLTGSYAQVRHEIGAGGHHTEAWKSSDTAAWLRAHSLEGPVPSNEQHAMYLLGGVSPRPASRAPHPDEYLSTYFSGGLSPPYHVVCFSNPDRGHLHPRRVVQEALTLVPFVSATAVDVPPLPSRREGEKCSDLVAPQAVVDTVATLSDGRVLRVEASE
jgi:hypothetical protein